MWEDAAANSVGAGGVDMPADVQQDKKKKKPVYDGRTKAGRKFVEKMLARRKAKAESQQVNAQKTNLASVQMKEDNIETEGYAADKNKKTKETLKKHDKAMIKVARDSIKKYNSKKETAEAKKPVSKMTPAEKAADAKRRKEYNAFQKSKR